MLVLAAATQPLVDKRAMIYKCSSTTVAVVRFQHHEPPFLKVCCLSLGGGGGVLKAKNVATHCRPQNQGGGFGRPAARAWLIECHMLTATCHHGVAGPVWLLCVAAPPRGLRSSLPPQRNDDACILSAPHSCLAAGGGGGRSATRGRPRRTPHHAASQPASHHQREDA